MENKKQRELIHHLVDLVLDIQEKTNHYASVNMSNYGSSLNVQVAEGGWDAEKDYSLVESFEKDKIIDSVRFRRTLDYLDGLISREEASDEESIQV